MQVLNLVSRCPSVVAVLPKCLTPHIVACSISGLFPLITYMNQAILSFLMLLSLLQSSCFRSSIRPTTMHFLTLLTFAAPLVSAIQLTAPTANSTIFKGSEYSLTWSSVDTDPTTFSVYLVNFVNFPPTYVQLSTNIKTSTTSTKVHIPCDTDPSYGYQFNAINGTNLYVIYAQSPKFSVGGKACVDSTSKPTNTTASTCAKETITVYVTASSSPSSGYVNSTSAPYPTSFRKLVRERS
jgi:Ser-Thr-rich glycosyl-phosphatidyl-inositol-anchored membrane family